MAVYLQSTAYTRSFLLVQSSDHITGLTGATPVVSISKAGGTFATAGGMVSAIGNGWYDIALTTSDTNTLGDLSFHITAAGADPSDFTDQIVNSSTWAGGASSSSGSTTVTLTASSAKSQSITMTASGQSVVLPDATTLLTGGPIFSIANSGGLPFAIRRNDQTILTVLAGGGTADIYLDDNSTSGGVWHYVGSNTQPGIILLDYLFSAADYVGISTGTACGSSVVYFLKTSSSFYAVALDISTTPATVGTPTLVSGDNVLPIYQAAVDSTHILCVWKSSPDIEGIVVTVSGNAVSVGTKTSLSSTTMSTVQGLALSGNLHFLAYLNGSFFLNAVAVGVSGTTVTFGTSVSISGASASLQGVFSISSSSAIVFYDTSASTAECCALSISGTTVTLGSALVIANSAGNVGVAPMSATSYMAVTNESGTAKAYVVTVSGTTCTKGSSLTCPGTIYAPGSPVQAPHVFTIDGSHALVSYSTGASFTGLTTIIGLANSAGTPTLSSATYVNLGRTLVAVVSSNLFVLSSYSTNDESDLYSMDSGNITYLYSIQNYSPLSDVPVFVYSSLWLNQLTIGSGPGILAYKIDGHGLLNRGAIQIRPLAPSTALSPPSFTGVSGGRISMGALSAAVGTANANYQARISYFEFAT